MVPIVDIPELNNEKPAETQLAEWEAQLWDRGYLMIPKALPQPAVSHYLDRIKSFPPPYRAPTATSNVPRPGNIPTGAARVRLRLFEHGMDFVHLLENEPVFSLMERILGSKMHIISLQAHCMSRGNEITTIHPDELYLERPENVSDDVEYPPIINTINCHYYLVDVPEELGPTCVVPGSHRACRDIRPEDGDPPRWRGEGPVLLTVEAGDCVIYSNQTWHAGSENRTDQARYAVVPAYSRRFVAQRFWPFLNYNLSRDILDQCTPRQRELLGEHQRGAYG